jgi:hypothetical protein
MHSGGGKKHRRVVIGQQGLALDLGMAFGSEKFDIFGTKFVGCHGFIIYEESFPGQGLAEIPAGPGSDPIGVPLGSIGSNSNVCGARRMREPEYAIYRGRGLSLGV